MLQKIILLFFSMLFCSYANASETIKTLFTSSKTQVCDAGVMKKECLLVKLSKSQQKWEYFYNDIEGSSIQFSHIASTRMFCEKCNKAAYLLKI